MDKKIMKMLVAGLTCVTLCGTSLAAPARGNGSKAPQKATTHQQAPTSNRDRGRASSPAPARQSAPMARNTPAPAPERHHNPPAPERHHDDHHCEGVGLITLGAAVVGGIVGGIVSACH